MMSWAWMSPQAATPPWADTWEQISMATAGCDTTASQTKKAARTRCTAQSLPGVAGGHSVRKSPPMVTLPPAAAALGSNAGRAAQPPCQQGTGYGSGDAALHENLVQPTPGPPIIAMSQAN